MKYQTEEMLSDSLTKVMTMPKHHVKKCGLKDLQLATIAMVMASQVLKAEATAEAVCDASGAKDDHPGSEWFVLRAAMVLFMVGLLAGMFLMKKLQALTTRVEPVRMQLMSTAGTQPSEQKPAIPRQVFIAPASGTHYHTMRSCPGLGNAGEKREMKACKQCAKTAD